MYKKISDKEFVIILDKAVNGDINAIYQIIDIYDELIRRNSMINGRFNQDCRDYIEEKIIKEITKFKKIKKI